MICPRCDDAGTPQEMAHHATEVDRAVPGDPVGVTQHTVCWEECPRCGRTADCDGSAHLSIEEEE